jgi:hypothetical protein
MEIISVNFKCRHRFPAWRWPPSATSHIASYSKKILGKFGIAVIVYYNLCRNTASNLSLRRGFLLEGSSQ